ncbi:MAG TPA: MG2 domain-containing protein, partial [Burkholderiales bacterium]|nr:MG2 domain-containing protein [Burkholderiales bacterium]
IFTDRPLYRPGEIVHIKGIVRYLGTNGLDVESGREGKLTVFQPRNRGENEIVIHTDDRGAFETQIVLDSSTTGHYGMRLQFEGRERDSSQGGFGTGFQVADFQPNAFELNVAAPARFAPDAEIGAEVSARYFFGSSLGKSGVRWTLQYSPEEFTPDGFVGLTFGAAERPEQKTLTLHDEGTLSETGTFSIRPKLPAAQDRPYRGLFTVEVTDLNQQTVSESRAFMRNASDFYLGLKMPEEYVIGHAQEIVARAVAVRPDGEAVTEPVEVKAELVRVRYETVRVQGAGNAIAFHSETREEVAETKTGRTLIPTRRGRDWELPGGETARFKPEKAGRYLLRVSAKDKAGRTTVASFGFNVSGTDAVAWDYRNPAQVDLVADKPEYRAGDKARILVKTPISGEALITIERGARILRTQRVQLTGNAPTFDVPIEAGDAPNVFVSLMLIRGAEESTRKFKVPEYRYSVCRLNIGDPTTQLKVEVAPAADTAQPGDEVA